VRRPGASQQSKSRPIPGLPSGDSWRTTQRRGEWLPPIRVGCADDTARRGGPRLVSRATTRTVAAQVVPVTCWPTSALARLKKDEEHAQHMWPRAAGSSRYCRSTCLATRVTVWLGPS
jgi:hypothetical protein